MNIIIKSMNDNLLVDIKIDNKEQNIIYFNKHVSINQDNDKIIIKLNDYIVDNEIKYGEF